MSASSPRARGRRDARGTLLVTAPPDAQVAPEGDYIMYLIAADGAPSPGRHVRLK